MAKILYIFPHPDDESFGPAPVIAKQKRQGHEVFLLTFTKGGATKQRFKYNYSIEQMGEVRFKEMQEVEKVLQLDGMTVLDFPDSGLKEIDPRELEEVTKDHIEKIKPSLLITYPVHGISGFHDHIVCHAIVKRVFLELKLQGYLKRLAFLTLSEQQAKEAKNPNPAMNINFSKPEEIDCIVEVEEQDLEKFRQALDCYKTYQDVIQRTDIKNFLKKEVYFEIFQEKHEPPLNDLCDVH